MKNTYFEQRNKSTLIKLRQVMAGLPDFAHKYFVGIEQTTSPLTRLNYAYDIRLFLGYLSTQTDVFKGKAIKNLEVSDLNDITAEDIENFLSFLTHYETENSKEFTNSDIGKARKLSSIKSFFSYFYNKELIRENVTQKVRTPKIHDKPIIRLETDEISKLITVAESGKCLSDHEQAYHNKTKERDVAMITLMLGTGIRVSECVGLNLDDLDFETNGIRITRKGGNQEIVYFGDEVRIALLQYLRVRAENKDARGENALFLSLQNKRITVRSVQKLVKKYASITTPLKKITPHKLRSTFGTELYRETKDIYIVADVLGHKDVNTTKKHYAAMSEDIRRNVANVIKLRDDASDKE